MTEDLDMLSSQSKVRESFNGKTESDARGREFQKL